MQKEFSGIEPLKLKVDGSGGAERNQFASAEVNGNV